MLEKQIRKAILETKDNKEKLLIEENLVKSRILMIVESENNIKNFHKLPKKKQEKMARLCLGLQIIKSIETNGSCSFNVET